MRATIENNGIPISIYADRHAIFVSPKDSKITIEEELKGIQANDTQFGRALKDLGITLIKARSAQAKGRIERLWETLQSRLPIEFALADITTIDAANTFLKTYIKDYNATFAVKPEECDSAYRELSPAINLDNILCVMEERTFDKCDVFSFYNRKYKIVSNQNERTLPFRCKIKVLISPVFGIRISFAGIIYDVVSYVEPKKVVKPKKKRKGRYIPEDSHYYKYGHKLIKKVTFEDSDTSILKMLEKIFLWELPNAM